MIFGGNEILGKIKLYGTKLTKEPLGSGFGAVAEHLVALPSGKKVTLGKSMKNCYSGQKHEKLFRGIEFLGKRMNFLRACPDF